MDATDFICNLGRDAAQFLSAYQYVTRDLRSQTYPRGRLRGSVHGFAQAQEQVLVNCNRFLQEQIPECPPITIPAWDPTERAHAFLAKFLDR